MRRINVNSPFFSHITWRDGRMDIEYSNGRIDRGYLDINRFDDLIKNLGSNPSDQSIMDILVPLTDIKDV